MKYVSENEQQTQAIATELANKLKGGEVLALSGDLGAGKTTFIKGLGRALGIKKNITSPTFVLMKVYPVKSRETGIRHKGGLFHGVNPVKNKIFCHIDAYRIENPQELTDIGVLENFRQKDSICAVEWAEKIKNLLPRKRIEIKLQLAEKENQRIIEINFLE